MYARLPRISSLADVQSIEQTPLKQRNLPKNTYEIFKHSAELYGNKIALRFLFSGTPDEATYDYTYNDLLKSITQTANAFRHLTINKKEVVSILLPNIPQNHFALWGAETVGVANPINPMLHPKHIIGIMNAAKSKVLVTLAPFPGVDLWEKVTAIVEKVPTLETILTISLGQFLPSGNKAPNDSVPRLVRGIQKDFDELIASQSSETLELDRLPSWEDIACYFHTGGTTGTPKIAVHSHGNQVFSAWMIGQQLAWEQADVMHCGLPLFHVNAPLISGLGPIMAGGEVIMTSPQGFRSPTVLDNFWSLIEKYKISFFMGVPAVYVELNKRWNGKSDISSLKIAGCGAAPMPTAVIEEFNAKTKTQLVEGYGLTEGTVFSAVNPAFGQKHIGSIGLRIPYQEMQAVILDNQGKFLRNCKPNEMGTIAICGPNVFQGYLRDGDNKNSWIKEGWLNTGDLGQQNNDGYFKLSGRSKDLIIRGGHNIDPQLIEEILSKHPKVAMVSAVGKPDVRVGELPVAYVSLREGQSITEKELLTFASAHISERAATPTNIYIIDKIPLTAVGKIYKPALRLDAIRRTFEETLKSVRDRGIDFDLTIQQNPEQGQIAIISFAEEVLPELTHEIHALLKGFAIPTEITCRI